MHFITELVNNPIPNDPIKECPHVHRHFTRYSKGYFDGPAMKIRVTKSSITINGSFEFEDFLLEIASKTINQLGYTEEFIVNGSIIAPGDFTPHLQKIGLNWTAVKSKGQTKNYKCVIKPAEKKMIDGTKLAKLTETLTKIAYVLFTFKAGPSGQVSMKTAKNPPRPKQSNGKANSEEKDQLAARLKFATLKIPYSQEILDYIISEIFKDFKDEIPSSFKNIIIKNHYEITDLILPDRSKVKNSSLIRKLTLRKGILTRQCLIDSKISYSNVVEFTI